MTKSFLHGNYLYINRPRAGDSVFSIFIIAEVLKFGKTRQEVGAKNTGLERLNKTRIN
ncbi:MAG: hypothetical protein Q8N21_04135 [bacterium]|nr:hypothetical protein [bacterium]